MTEASEKGSPDGPCRRLLFLLPNLGGGGAERVILTLLRHLHTTEWDCHLGVIRAEGAFRDEVPGHVKMHDLGARRVRSSGLRLLRLTRALGPAIVFSTLSYLNLYLLLLRPWLPGRTRVVVREGITLSADLPLRRYPAIWSNFIRRFYPRADRVVCQCEFMRDDLVRNFRIPEDRTEVIYNPVDVARVRRQAAAGENPFVGRGPHVVAAGRLTVQKGLDRLIESVPGLLRLHPDARVWVLGDDPASGRPEHRRLEELARARGVAQAVNLVGFEPNPYRWFAHADLFVLPSRYEGLPNVLLEAMACGCPTVALDNPGGTAEIMSLTGQEAFLRTDLDWDADWLGRAWAPDRPDADLSAFELDTVLRRYAALFSEIAPPGGEAAG